MNKEQKFYNIGCGWVSALGYGTSGLKPKFSEDNVSFCYPELRKYIPELPSRFGRFDVYSKLSFSAAVLALADANLLQRDEKKNMGIVVGSHCGVYDNDLAYFESTKEAKGAFTSPNLFSYTLPNVALGEIAVFFRFIGPTFCVGNDSVCLGSDVLSASLSLLATKGCDSVLMGWVETARNIEGSKSFPKGAAFSIITLENSAKVKGEFMYTRNISFMGLFEEH